MVGRLVCWIKHISVQLWARDKVGFKTMAASQSIAWMGVALLAISLAACAPATVGASSPSQQTVVASMVAATLTQAPASTAIAQTEAPQASPTPVVSSTPKPTPLPSPTPGPTLTATPDKRPDPNAWASWPAIPTVSGRAKEIYLNGITNGLDPRSFSTIGDCQSEPNVFLGIYDTNRYILGKDDQYLKETVDFYQTVFGRQSLAVRDGLSAPSALSPKWAYADKCEANENPVQCELRVHKPSVMFINLGTNWRADASTEAYEKYLRQIVDLLITNGTLPVLSTKADNVEGGNRINQATARVAHDYDIPLWNFWATAQYLPNHGLDKSRQDVYLTVEAWDARSYTALKVLDTLRREFLNVYVPSQSH
jgi:hypothetical protein